MARNMEFEQIKPKKFEINIKEETAPTVYNTHHSHPDKVINPAKMNLIAPDKILQKDSRKEGPLQVKQITPILRNQINSMMLSPKQ